MNRTRTALVIGGGIAGPVAALALQRAGIEATVYEAYGSAADGVGGGLSIAPNGLNALAVVGADDAVLRVGVPLRAMVMQSWTGKRLAEFASPPDLPVMQFVWRTDLYRALYDVATSRGINFEHGKRLTSAEQSGPCVAATFSGGASAEADVLIGADGIRSTVRKLIDPAAPEPRYTKLLGFGALLQDMGQPSTGGKMHMVFGKRAFLGYQVEDDGSGGWFANLPYDRALTAGEAQKIDAAEWIKVLRKAFANDRSPALAFLDGTEPTDLVITGALEDIPRVPTWHRGRMVIIGDAAHPTSPSSGQGASLAAESAVQLARCLRDLPHEQAFLAYERLRRKRVERIIAMAARTNSDKAAGPIARILRDAIMPIAMKYASPKRWAWQFDHHINWDDPVDSPPPAVQ